MEAINERPICHRADDLVTYLYDEAIAEDARDFATHLQQCDACRSEFNLFSQVHDSIVSWRSEVLGPMTVRAAGTSPSVEPVVESTTFGHQPRKLSAAAALRQFLNVSPVWLRGATAFAVVALCALLVFTALRLSRKPAPVVNDGNEAKHSQQEFDNAVRAKVEEKIAQINKQNDQKAPVAGSEPNIKKPRLQLAVNRVRSNPRPRLSREEREQLAADLGLIPGRDEELPFVLPDQPNP